METEQPIFTGRYAIKWTTFVETCKVKHYASMFLAFFLQCVGFVRLGRRKVNFVDFQRSLGPWTGQSDRQGVARPWFSPRCITDLTPEP